MRPTPFTRRRQAILAPRLDTRLADARARNAELEQEVAKVTFELHGVMRRGVDPYVRSILMSLRSMDLDDLCFLGPNGCDRHQGWTVRRDGFPPECGIAWLKSWLYRENQTPPRIAAFCQVVADGGGEASHTLLGALKWYDDHLSAMVDVNARGGDDEARIARTELRTVRAMIHTLENGVA